MDAGLQQARQESALTDRSRSLTMPGSSLDDGRRHLLHRSATASAAASRAADPSAWRACECRRSSSDRSSRVSGSGSKSFDVLRAGERQMEVGGAPAQAKHRVDVPAETIDDALRHANVARAGAGRPRRRSRRRRAADCLRRGVFEIAAGLAERLLPSGRLIVHEAVQHRERRAASRRAPRTRWRPPVAARAGTGRARSGDS